MKISDLLNEAPKKEYYNNGNKRSICGAYDFCTEIKTVTVNEWIGIIYKLNTTVDGFIVPQIAMPTLENIGTPTETYLSGGSVLFTSDRGYHYLIKPENSLYNIFAELKQNDRVLLSGEFFIDEDTGYLKTEEIMKKNQIGKPEFTFRFTNIQKIN